MITTIIITVLALLGFLMILGLIRNTIVNAINFVKKDATYLKQDAIADVQHGLTFLKGELNQHPTIVKLLDEFKTFIAEMK